jgi:hypothetical protein
MKEKIEMYAEKKKFVENINEVFQMEPRCPSVEGVVYEVYMKKLDDDRVDTREWVVVHFHGGGKCPKIVGGNSNIANFKVIGGMLTGGYYSEVQTYQEQVNNGYEMIEL